jgi:hypothetical protein
MNDFEALVSCKLMMRDDDGVLATRLRAAGGSAPRSQGGGMRTSFKAVELVAMDSLADFGCFESTPLLERSIQKRPHRS